MNALGWWTTMPKRSCQDKFSPFTSRLRGQHQAHCAWEGFWTGSAAIPVGLFLLLADPGDVAGSGEDRDLGSGGAAPRWDCFLVSKSDMLSFFHKICAVDICYLEWLIPAGSRVYSFTRSFQTDVSTPSFVFLKMSMTCIVFSTYE